MPPPPCASCHVARRQTTEEFYVKCSECNRCWHDGCLYERMRHEEIQERNRRYSHDTVPGSWFDWTCRRCRGEGEEGREHRPVKKPDVHDLTLDSDDDDASSAPKPKPGPSVGSLSTTAPRPTPATGRNRRVPMKSAPIPQRFRPPPPQVTPLPTKQTEDRPASAKVPPTAAPKPTPAPTLSRRVPVKSATLASQKPYAPHAMPKLPSSKLPHDKEVVDLVSSDDEIQIVDPPDKSRNSTRPPETYESPTPKKEDQPTIDAQDTIPDTQEPPTLDIRDLSLEESVHDPPLPEFPSSEPTPFDHRLGPTVVAPRLAPVLPPALRPSTRSILGQRLVGATERDRIVQMIGLEALKSGRWKLESRIRESVSLEPNPPRTGPDKGKGRAVGERTRDWTPLLQQEQTRERQAQQLRLQVPTAMFLVPPSPPTINPTLTQNVHPPRKPRKSTTVVHRDDTVKLEPVEFALS